MSRETSILCVAPFNNPHIVPVYDKMADCADVKAVRASMLGLSPERVRLGWPEMAADSPYLQPWRRKRDWWPYLKALMGSDVVVLPGFVHFRTLPLHHWLRRLTGKPTTLWSEAFLDHPRSASWGRLSRTIRKLLFWPCDSESYTLLALGHDSARDFIRMGVRRWKFRRFVFAVESPAEPPRSVTLRVADDVHILYVGALSRRKGVDLLIGALGSPQLASKRWRLTVVGDGEERQGLEKQVRRLGIEDRVTFSGALPLRQCEDVYRDGDVLVLPSRFDGWGAVVNEAMEYGLAAVTSHLVGARTPLIADGVNGRVFCSGDTADLARCLQDVVADPVRLTKMRQASLDRIRMFRPAEAARALVALCRALAGHAPMPDFGDGLCGLIDPVAERERG